MHTLRWCATLLIIGGVLGCDSGQRADPAFRPVIRQPTYTEGSGPVIWIDEPHHNIVATTGRLHHTHPVRRRLVAGCATGTRRGTSGCVRRRNDVFGADRGAVQTEAWDEHYRRCRESSASQERAAVANEAPTIEIKIRPANKPLQPTSGADVTMCCWDFVSASRG